MTFTKGSLVLIDYTAKVKDTNEVFETTIESKAKEHSLHDPNIKYQPKLVSIGESWVLKGLDDSLLSCNAGEQKTLEVPPEKGFGERDKGKVRMIPLRKLGEDADKVSVGDTIEVDQKKGIVRYIGSGRVQVDFNHRFAGKTIVYDFKIVKSLESDEDKILGIIKRHLPVEDEKISFKKINNAVEINIPEELFRADGLQVIKHFLQVDIFKFIPALEKVNFIEIYSNKKIKNPAEEKTSKESPKIQEKPVEQKTK